MNAKHIITMSVALACLLASGESLSGVVAQARVPNTSGGATISCRNPVQTLGIVRTKDSTRIFQARPDGIHWQIDLPPMIAEHDQYWMAPDGAAAVVAISTHADTAEAFLVTGHHKAIEIDGVVLSVDFQGDLALVATVDHRAAGALAANEDPETNAGTRIRVYSLSSGKLVGDTWFADAVPLIMKEFYVRLSGDGRHYYYVANISGREMAVVRDVVSGQKHEWGYSIAGSINDMLMYSQSRGHVVRGGKVYRLGGRELIPVQPNDDVGAVDRLVESVDRSIQAVTGNGWGVFDTSTGSWIATGKGSSLHSSKWGLTVVDMSIDSKSVRTYDFPGMEPRLVRSSSGETLDARTLVCANAFGFMKYRSGAFIWHKSN